MPNRNSTRTNPFYVLLVVIGIVFVITVCAYFTMTLREANGQPVTAGLLGLLARHGLTVLIVELVLLAGATFGAIGTDEYWTAKEKKEDAT